MKAMTPAIVLHIHWTLIDLAVPSQAFIIALTSDFIPRLVYTMAYSPDGSLKGYVNQTLAVFNTSDFDESHRPVFEGSDSVESCR